MKCYANRVTTRLFSIPQEAPVTVTTAGTKQRILPEQADRQSDSVQEFKFITLLVVAGGANSPTAQLVIQGSVDGALWIDLLLGTVRTEPGTYFESLDSNTVGILPWVRARVVLAGGTAPSATGNVDGVGAEGAVERVAGAAAEGEQRDPESRHRRLLGVLGSPLHRSPVYGNRGAQPLGAPEL